HIQDVVALVEDGSLDDIILVGHSYGGMVITGVGARIGARIRTLVYLDAFLPGDGESLWDIAGERARKHYIDGQRDTPGLVKPFPRAGVQHPRTLQPLLTMLEPVRLTGEEAKVANRSYIYATANLPSSFTRFHDQVRDDPAWTVHEIATGHMVMLEDPEGLAALLLGEAGR
ncbi:MAG: alpha/beta fold hydrolase, partial [Sphingobium sp.]